MNKQVIYIDLSFKRTMLIVAERFIVASLINKLWQAFRFNSRRWYMVSASLSFFETETPSPYSSFEKSIIERTMQYVKDRTEYCFDEYFPCKRKKKCKLKHVKNWLNLFAYYYNIGISA